MSEISFRANDSFPEWSINPEYLVIVHLQHVIISEREKEDREDSPLDPPSLGRSINSVGWHSDTDFHLMKSSLHYSNVEEEEDSDSGFDIILVTHLWSPVFWGFVPSWKRQKRNRCENDTKQINQCWSFCRRVRWEVNNYQRTINRRSNKEDLNRW